MRPTLLSSALCLVVLISCVSALTIPDGYLLVFKKLNVKSLFRVDFNGSVQLYWNYTLDDPLYSDNLFAVDTENQLVYVGAIDLLLGLGLTTGKVVVKKPLKVPNLLYFWNFDYVEEENAILGVCTGNNAWNWCRVKLGEPEVTVEFLYHLPGVFELGPTSDIYYMDKSHQSIWYLAGLTFAYATNYTTGKQIFLGNMTYSDLCILHDHKLNRTFAVARSGVLTEIHPLPKQETKLLTLPPDVRLASIGMCTYNQDTHTVILLMSSASNYLTDAMPTQLLFIDVVSLNTKSVALPEFRQWKSPYSVSAVKYIPNKNKD